MKRNLPLFLLLSLWCAGCAPALQNKLDEDDGISSLQEESPETTAPEEKTSAQDIRIAIATHQHTIHLKAPQDFVLSGFPQEAVFSSGSGSKPYREVNLTPDMLYGGKAYIHPQSTAALEVNGRRYKGSIEIVEDDLGTFTLINEVGLEDYVMGVLAGEVPRNWPLEALKAQAIAARTFAVLKRSQARDKGLPYDLENTAFYQIYQGSDLVNVNIQKAVAQTQGQIATYDGRPILAFFHSNCGGRTCAAEDVWSQGQPYLQPVDCPYGDEGAHFRWTAHLSVETLLRDLDEAGVHLADIAAIRTKSADGSGRILKLSIMDSNGRSQILKGSVFRMAVGPDLIRSTRFSAEVDGGEVHFEGRGWGHGVGLCQEGACGMASKGYSADDILKYYYRGISIENLKDL